MMKEPLSLSDFFAALARSGRQLIIRVDDVGMGDSEERSLLIEIAEMGHSVNAAVVPFHAVTAAEWLVPLVAAHSGRIEVHQHGWSHTNHESVGRKAEFGPARPFGRKAEEIAKGKALLEEMFGPAFVSVFCPPWNRLSDDVLDICRALAFAGVSAFGQVLVQPPMRDVSANIDVTKACRMGIPPGNGLLLAASEVLSRAQGPRMMVHPNVLADNETDAFLAFLAHAAAFGVRGVPFSSLVQ